MPQFVKSPWAAEPVECVPCNGYRCPSHVVMTGGCERIVHKNQTFLLCKSCYKKFKNDLSKTKVQNGKTNR